MADQLDLYVFGDQTFDTQPSLKELIRYRHNPVLEDFLVKAYDSIRTEIYELPREMRDDLPRFTCLDDLILWKQDGKQCIALDMATTCLYQLGMFMGQAGSSHYSADNARVLGLCTGALTAAAVSCSCSTLELIPLAVDAVTVAFRTGMQVADVAQRVEPWSDRSWSVVVPGLASAEAVHAFAQQTILPRTSKPYVSAYAPNGITVSGPPRSLAQLIDSENFKHLRVKSVKIYGPYHAPHLYSEHDVEQIVGCLASCSAGTCPNRIPLVSGAGATVEGGNFETLLKAAVEQILLQPIRWPAVLEVLQKCFESVAPKSFRIAPIGTTADQLIYTALKQTSLRELLLSTPAQSRPNLSSQSTSPPKYGKSKLAIIGMSGRFPGAKDNDAFWDLLYQGLDVHRPAPALHWDTKTHVDPTGKRKNTSATPFGCWLDDPDVFDARFFNISPREAPQIDPAQRLSLMTAYEAIEQAGIVSDATPSTRRDRVGVFYGVTSNDWLETNSAQSIDAYFIPGGNRAFIPGRINYCFKFSGPSYAVDTACSSSLAGIHLACNSLWRGDIDTAIAGGTNVLTNPDFTAGLDRGHFLSRTGNCRTFDDSADGYCRGEGIGTVIIKRLDDAIADNDPILGVIVGAYTNHSAESETITRPHVGAQRAIFSKILNSGAVDPYSVSYIEMHGTGTQAGDAGEMSSVLDTFAPPLNQVKKGRSSEEALYLGSAKANIGHGEAASGVSSLIKVLLMMKNDMIVPHSGIKTKINRKFPTDLQERNVNIALKPTAWERSSDPSKPRRAFVNNFSAAGGNSAILLEDAPLEYDILSEAADKRSHHLVAVSAKNGASLQGNLKSMLRFLQQNLDIPLGQLSYTTTARRVHHQHRVMLTGSSVKDLCPQIEAALRDQTGMTRPKSSPKVVFTFTGQGAQYPGMGKQFFENFSSFRSEMCRLDQIEQSLGFPSVLPLIQSEEQDISIFSPTAVQLANVCMQIALSKLWASWNIVPTAVIGHSLGEYAALNVAGVLSDADTLYLAGMRADLLQAKCTRDTHSMLVTKGSVDEIAAALKDNTYEIACINSPTETVLAGSNKNISIYKGLLTDAGLKSTLLKVPYAFHSSQVEPVLADLEKAAHGATFSEPRIPVLCPLDGSVIERNGSFGPDYLARHCREPVNMLKALLTAKNDHVITDQTTMLEIGPHPAISGMVSATLGQQMTTLASSQRGRSAWQVLTVALKNLYAGGADICWSKYHYDFKVSHKVILLPAYSWDLQKYWMQYVNDWSLRKGDPPLMIDNALKLESTTIHRIVKEIGDSKQTQIIVEADITRKDLSPLVQGHEVDGVPLCTPSVYSDIALSLGTYLLKRYQPNQQENLVDVSDMIISKALILRAGATQQLLQAHAEVDWSSKAAAIKFMSFDNQQKIQEHSRCVVRFKDRIFQEILQKNAASVKQKMQALRDGIAEGTTARFNRPMVFRAIRPLARFHDDYRAINEIVMNSETREASSHLRFDSVKRGGDFHTHPAIIDSLSQSCGFAMNCNDSTDLDKEVFMNHGWGSFQIFEPICLEKEYTTYTRMVEGVDNLWHGDVIVFEGERVVAYFGQLAIQGVPRRVLKVVLSIESGNKSQKARHTSKNQTSLLAPTPSINATQGLAPVSEDSHASKIKKASLIIAEESGLASTDLTDTTGFGDVGIDSLLGLTISARFKEEIDIDLDFDSLFYEHPTVGDLKTFLGSPKASATGVSTPRSQVTDTSAPSSYGTGVTTPTTDDDSAAPKVDPQRALQIVSEESGVATDDLTDDTNFTDVGVDSLLSLVIMSRFKDELDLDVQHESFFLDCPTVADLKQLLVGDTNTSITTPSITEGKTVSTPAPALVEHNLKSISTPLWTESEIAALTARKKAVDDYVEKTVAGFSAPVSSPASTLQSDNEKVVLVTGASGSLGGHLVYHLAHLPDVKTVVCLNRENRAEPYTRQQKAMRDKGIRFPESLKHKLLVLQTDSSKPMFGLQRREYENLVHSVTHLIHNAWPMSAKRLLSGFASQFTVMRTLIDFASAVASHRPPAFQFTFQMISSIGVVGHYGLPHNNSTTRTLVPEDRVTIDAVLPNGYGDAKWACERILDATLHQHPTRFRAMTARLGQIAGSKTSGYWNPTEHFGFVVKSSQTLDALPDVPGSLHWTPVNDVAAALADLLLCTGPQPPVPIYHVENAAGQPWAATNKILFDALGVKRMVPFDEWVGMVRDAPAQNNPAKTLLEFLDDNYLRMSCGGLVLDTEKARGRSATLRGLGEVSEEVVRRYVRVWREIGFLR